MTATRLLVIDDSPADARLPRNLPHESASESLQLTVVGTLTAGIAHLSEVGADAVFLDAEPAGDNGLSMLDTLSQHFPDLPVLFIGDEDATRADRQEQHRLILLGDGQIDEQSADGHHEQMAPGQAAHTC